MAQDARTRGTTERKHFIEERVRKEDDKEKKSENKTRENIKDKIGVTITKKGGHGREQETRKQNR